jgi:cobalt-zinc-cadmium efflux system protein
VVLGLNLALVVGLVAAGLMAHSLAVLAAGADYLADAAAIGVSLLAVILTKRPPTARRLSGYPRATAYAALLNATLLLLVVVLVAIGAARRLDTGVGSVHGLPVLIASGVAALAMLGGGLILKGDEANETDSEGDRANMRAAVLDTLADSAAAGGVAVTGAIILVAPSLSWLDPAVALIISAVIGYHAFALVRDVIKTLRGAGGLRSPAAQPTPTAHATPGAPRTAGAPGTAGAQATHAPDQLPRRIDRAGSAGD